MVSLAIGKYAAEGSGPVLILASIILYPLDSSWAFLCLIPGILLTLAANRYGRMLLRIVFKH